MRAGTVLIAIAFLALTVALWFAWSSVRLMEADEYLSYYSDRVPTLVDVLFVQLHYPISLDPPTYHFLSHLAMNLFGSNPMALRLPSLLGFLMFQISSFFFARRIAGDRAGLVALVFPLLTYSFFYSVQGRPYGLLLGLYACSIACWQAATRGEQGKSRAMTLTGIAVIIALAITSHFFGILILLPIGFGELARTLQRRRSDKGIFAAILVGASFSLAVLPFQRAVSIYRQHYYSTSVSLHIIPQSYGLLFFYYQAMPRFERHLTVLGMTIATLILFLAVIRRSARNISSRSNYEWVAIFVCALLPVFGYVLGKAVAHTMDSRYVIAALFSFAVCTGIVCKRLLRNNMVFYSAMFLLFVWAAVVNYMTIRIYGVAEEGTLARLEAPQALYTELRINPEQRIYTQALDHFYVLTLQEPDAEIRSRMCLVYGKEQEIHWLGHDTNYITAVNMHHFAPLCTISYQEFLKQPNPLVVMYHSNWEWLESDINSRGTPITHIGDGLHGGTIVKVQNIAGGS